jgi:hypothetical protein
VIVGLALAAVLLRPQGPAPLPAPVLQSGDGD